MRLWMVDPKVLCRKHLLGEHVESHMFMGSIRKGISLKGYVSGGLVEVHHVKVRHDALAQEMTRRGYNHHSPMHEQALPEAGRVDKVGNLQELARRCSECKKMQEV